jgi:Ca2+-binding RTX toxin-like protein
VNYTLGANVESLMLSGHAAINGTGNELNNVLVGNDAANTLHGGLGNDLLIGGAGADMFVFDTAPAINNIDTIADFSTGVDHFTLDSSVFAGTGLHNQTLTANMFHAGAGFTTAAGANDHLIFNSSTGNLYYDADGIGGQAAVQIAIVHGSANLSASDFFIA